MGRIDLESGEERSDTGTGREESKIKKSLAGNHAEYAIKKIKHAETAKIKRGSADGIQACSQCPDGGTQMQNIVDQIEFEQTEHEAIGIMNSRNIVQ